MNKKNIIIVLIIALIISIGFTSAYFFSSMNLKNELKTISYKIKLIGSGGVFSSSVVNIKNNSVILPVPIKNGYTFLGYSETENGDSIFENNINNVNEINNKTLYAIYEEKSYKISYNLNNGYISNLKNSYTINDTFTLPIPTKSGYTFTGWTGTGLSSLTKTVTIPKGSNGDRNYTANWQIENYTISYNLDGGTATLNTSYNVESNTFTLPIPTRSGYTFTGWTGTGLSSLTKTVTIPKGSTGNRSYTANWKKYDANDYGGIYLISLRDGATWNGKLDGTFNVGSNSVHSGNWYVTVYANSVYIYGTNELSKTHEYCMSIYRADNHNDLLVSECKSFGKYQHAEFYITW